MKTIKALQNFGHNGRQIEAGTVLDVNPEEFGGTFQDFVDAGLMEDCSPVVPVVSDPGVGAVKVKKGSSSVGDGGDSSAG